MRGCVAGAAAQRCANRVGAVRILPSMVNRAGRRCGSHFRKESFSMRLGFRVLGFPQCGCKQRAGAGVRLTRGARGSEGGSLGLGDGREGAPQHKATGSGTGQGVFCGGQSPRWCADASDGVSGDAAGRPEGPLTWGRGRIWRQDRSEGTAKGKAQHCVQVRAAGGGGRGGGQSGQLKDKCTARLAPRVASQ